MKTLFSFLMALFICLCATAQQKAAFKEIGKKQKLYSLSDGRFDEQFLNDPIQQIGSVEIDVATGKIKRLLPADSIGSAQEDMIVATRFLSVDPLSDKYPMLTPYQFASNTPIMAIDLDGLEGLPATEINSYGEKQMSYKRITKTNSFGVPTPSTVIVTPANTTPVTQGMTDVQVYRFVFTRFIETGMHLIKPDQYIDIRLMKAEQQIRYFFSHQVPAYSSSQAATSIAHAAIALGLMMGDESAVKQVQKSDDFLYRNNLAPWAATAVTAAYGMLEISAEEGLSITVGRSNNGGQSQFTAAKVKAPYYSVWQKLGIYNSSEFEGWGGAFKYITDKVVSSGGTIHFELSGLNVSEALAGDATMWVGRYTAWELQQVTLSKQLFSHTEFYLDGVKQTAQQLSKMGITDPK